MGILDYLILAAVAAAAYFALKTYRKTRKGGGCSCGGGCGGNCSCCSRGCKK